MSNFGLSGSQQKAILIISEDGAVTRERDGHRKSQNYFLGKSKRPIVVKTILALYDRRLVKIVIKSGIHAELTDLGVHVASGLANRSSAGIPERTHKLVSELT